jgi:hypothetical protein
MEGPPDKRNAAPTGNRDGAKNQIRTEVGTSETDKYARPNSSSTGKRTGQQKAAKTRDDLHPVFRFRPAQLLRFFKKRHGGRTLPDNDTGRLHAAIMLDHLVQGPDGEHEATVFLIRSSPWMAPAERADAIARAIKDWKFWSPSELGDALWLTWEERDACQITTIRPFWATDEDMAAFRTMKNTAARRETRQQETKPKKEPLPAIRAKIIADILQSGERCTIKDLCTALESTKKRIRLGHLKGNVLRAAVNDAIEYGVANGLLRKDFEPGLRGPVALISRLVGTEGDKRFVPPMSRLSPPSVSGCGHEKTTVVKTRPQLRVLVIEEGLSIRGVAAGPVVDGRARVKRATASTQTVIGHPIPMNTVSDLLLSSNKTVVSKEEGDCVVCLERTDAGASVEKPIGAHAAEITSALFDASRGVRAFEHQHASAGFPARLKARLKPGAIPAGPPLDDQRGTKRPGNRLVSLLKNDFPLSAAGVSPVRASLRN